MSRRRLTIVTSRPLPECTRCAAPMRRTTHALALGVCSGCRTTAESFAMAERATRLRSMTEAGRAEIRATADQRIERLAAKRSGRTGELRGVSMGVPRGP